MNLQEKLFNKAKKYHMSGQFKEAKNIYLDLIKLNEKNFLLHNLAGTTFLQLNEYDKAIKYLNIAIKLNPNFADSYNNIGIAFTEKQQFQKANDCYDKAIILKKNFFDAILNKSIALKNLVEYEESIKCLNLCIKINPKNSKIYINLGNIFVILKRYKDAKSAYDKAISLNKSYSEAYSNRGELFQKHIKDIKSAIHDYEKALKINNKLKFVYGKMIHAKMYINDWNNFDKQITNLKREIKNKQLVTLPFPILSLIDDPEIHKIIAEEYSKEIYTKLNEFDQKKLKIKNKIKIGYFSARFYDCATLHNMLDVFKNHNKDEFEIYAFNYGPTDTWTEKIKKYFNHFYDISKLPVKNIIKLASDKELQIAINLTGHTFNARDEIFSNQVAPIQINFLGYPGTMGTKIYDYIIADKTVISEDLKKFYSEKVLNLPNCYLPNQSNQIVSNKKFERKDFGIPEKKFVFGCFNNSYKITPSIFSCWMDILRRTDGSVLWLLQDDKIGQKNLLNEVKKQKINTNRIFFAERIAVEKHIKRIELIDLFLDTFPYNAHTTAKEAIKMKVPVLTMMGRSFASRVAASLLKNIGLDELIVNNLKDYTELAIKIANDKKKNNYLKNHLNDENNSKKLFDSKNYTKDLEKIYKDVIR